MAPRIVVLDIETSSLEADAGIVVGAGLLPETGKNEYFEAKRTDQEKDLLVKLLKRLEAYDVIVTWNGRGFDIPFLTTRLLKHALDPVPPLRTLEPTVPPGKAGVAITGGGTRLTVKVLDLVGSVTEAAVKVAVLAAVTVAGAL